MFAVEFEADIQDGKIEIPAEYRKQLGKHVKLIALTNEKAEETIQYSDEYIEKHWREMIITARMGSDFESSDELRRQREDYLVEKYK